MMLRSFPPLDMVLGFHHPANYEENNIIVVEGHAITCHARGVIFGDPSFMWVSSYK